MRSFELFLQVSFQCPFILFALYVNICMKYNEVGQNMHIDRPQAPKKCNAPKRLLVIVSSVMEILGSPNKHRVKRSQ